MPNDEQRAYTRYLDKISTEASVAETLKFEAEQKIRKEEQIKIAMSMKKKGYKPNEIAELTELTIKEIENLDNES